jgi:hypothetical protein
VEAEALVREQQGTKFDKDTFVDWYDQVGGVPRHLANTGTVEDAAGQQGACAKKIQFDPQANGTDKESNKIVMMLPREHNLNAADPVFNFVSANAWRAWHAAQGAAKAPELLKCLREARNDAARDVYGRYFERWFLQLVQDGGVFCRQLVDDKQVHPVERWEPAGKPTVTYFLGNDPSAITATDALTLHIPMSSNFPVIDAVLTWKQGNKNHASLMQVTVGPSHTPKSDKTKELLAALKKNGFNEWDFTWVVDPESKLASLQNVDGAAVASWKKLKQYICRIDDSMCWVCKKGATKAPTKGSLSFPLQNVTDEKAILAEVQKRVDSKAKKIVKFSSMSGPSIPGTPFRYS